MWVSGLASHQALRPKGLDLRIGRAKCHLDCYYDDALGALKFMLSETYFPSDYGELTTASLGESSVL